MIQHPEHEIRLHFLQWLSPFDKLLKIHCPVHFQQVFTLFLLFPLLPEIVPVFQNPIPGHHKGFFQCAFLHMAVSAAKHSLYLVPFAALPNPPDFPSFALPALPGEDPVTESAYNFRCEWVAFRVMGIRICPMLFQILLFLLLSASL